MTFRARLLLAFVGVVALALVVPAVGVRREVVDRLTAQYQRRVTSLVTIIEEDLARQDEEIGHKLSALSAALTDDNRFRLAVVQGAMTERAYLLDYATGTMRLAGLDLLQIQDEAGRILSSGHFRNEYDRLAPDLPALLEQVARGAVVVRVRAPAGPLVALARIDSLRLGGRPLTLVGGVAVDHALLARLTRDPELTVRLRYPGGELASSAAGDAGAPAPPAGDTVAASLAVSYVEAADTGAVRAGEAFFVVTYPLTTLAALRRSLNAWFLAATGVTAAVALLVAIWLAARISRPLAELARKTARVDLDRLDVAFGSDRRDEIGALSRLLAAMTARLEAGARTLRDAERRAAFGDLARQVNHDVKNGLIPVRNVLRHLAQVARDDPPALPGVFRERQGTLESGLLYLEKLAADYARLSPEVARGPCDANAVVREVTRELRGAGSAVVEEHLAPELPAVLTDRLALRRIVENLVANAVDSLAGGPGTVTVSTEPADQRRSEPAVRITVADTGSGMTREELARAFDDFYTTKEGGMGLGLSIVRRLVLDARGSLRVQTEPGKGSRFMVELPAANGPRELEGAGT